MILSVILLGTLVASHTTDTPRGDYVEARTASVYAGACHYGSEYTTAGREAVLAWDFSGGRHGGIELAGLELVVLVIGRDNLDRAETARRSIAYVPETASAAQREALLGWLRANHAAEIGELGDVRAAKLDVALAKGAFCVRAGETVELVGSEMPERACCKMPYNVWYRPFERLDARVVGLADSFRVSEGGAGVVFTRRDENCAFLGRFGPIAASR